MRKSRSQLVLFATVLSLLLPVQILACACCANEGQYYRGSGKIVDYQLELIKDMRFGEKAFLFSGEADLEEMAKGITLPKDSYEVNGSLVGNSWKVTFRDGSRSGVLSLSLPLRMETLLADIRDGKVSEGGGPLLYKEWRFEGRVGGTGFFKHGIVGTTRYSLVLQGRGNGCDNTEDFTTWRLDVKGTRAKYAFYGKLTKTN